MTQQEFKILFDSYFDSVRSYIYYRCSDMDLASDIAQEVFMKIWEKQLMPDKNKEKGLLYKMANDLFISHYRHQMVELNYSQSIVVEQSEPSPDTGLDYEELTQTYQRALSEMPEGQRVAFLMSRTEELKYAEIAERLQISVKAVEKRITNALSHLRAKLSIYETN